MLLITAVNHFFCSRVDGRSFVRLASRIKHVSHVHAYYACSAACIYMLFYVLFVIHSSLLVEFDLS